MSKLYDVWFIPDRDQPASSTVTACPSCCRGLDLEAARKMHAELCNTETAGLGAYKIKAASTWAESGYSWWAGSNEEVYQVGPHETREQALLEALSNDWDCIYLTQANKGKATFPHVADMILERYEESNEELGNPDGDGFTLESTPAQETDLQERLEIAFNLWMEQHGLEPRVWSFGDMKVTESFCVNLHEHLSAQIAFSQDTFGPGARKEGVVDHIRKELVEVETDPNEWVDVAILALDGFWRSRFDVTGSVEDILQLAEKHAVDPDGDDCNFKEAWAMLQGNPSNPWYWFLCYRGAMKANPAISLHDLMAKIVINKLRVWPDWRTADLGKAIEHDRSH